jgi:hypothetical protein
MGRHSAMRLTMGDLMILMLSSPDTAPGAR